MTVSTANNTNDKFLKKVFVDDHELLSFIDFVRECSLIRELDARKLGLQKNYSELPAIRGFGNSSVSPLYRSTISLKLDEVEACVGVLVVDDEFLHTPVLIGQDFTELPFFSLLKYSNRLIFYKSPALDDSSGAGSVIKLASQSYNEVQKVGLVELFTENVAYCGDVYIEGYNCSEPEREYHLHQGVYRINQGKGRVVVTNLRSENLSLPPNTLIARATPVVERKIYNVHRICKDLSAMEPLDQSDIKVGNNVSDQDRDKLYKLLQSYRDCFAMNLSEIGLAKEVEITIDLNNTNSIPTLSFIICGKRTSARYCRGAFAK